MKLSDLKTNYQTESNSKNHSKWELELNEQSDAFLETILDILCTDLEEINLDDERIQMAKNALELLNKIKVLGNSVLKDKINFIQLDYYSDLGIYFNRRGLFNYSFDCIIYCFSDEVNYKNEGEYHFDRIHKSTNISSAYIQQNFLDVFLNIISCVFYYSYRAGGLKEIASELYDFYLHLIIKVVKNYTTSRSVTCLCEVLTWSSCNNKNDIIIIVQTLEEIFDKQNVTDEIKKLICLQLGGGVYKDSRKTGKEWLDICFSRFRHLLIGHERLHLLSMMYANEELTLDKLSNINSAIEEYHSFGIRNLSNKRYELNRISNILAGIIINLFEKKRIKDIIQIIGNYYEIDPESLIDETLIVVSPNYKDGVLYCKEDGFCLLKKDMTKALIELVEKTNKFFNTQLVINNIPTSVVEKADRFGIPNEQYGNEFENWMIDHYTIKDLPDSFLSGINSIISFANYNHPLQNILIKYKRISMPIIISLQKILAYRIIQKMTIWNYVTASSDLEKEYVKKIFSNNNIKVKVFDGINSKKSDFIDAYFDKGTDLFWVITHGDFDEYSPHSSKIYINHSEFILGSELINYKGNSEDKRLCVLNICDSGRVHVDDGFLNMGMTAEITNKHQAVISHLWPINPTVALIYGVLLAISLTKTGDFFDAHESTIKIMLGGTSEINKEFNRLNFNELVEKVERSSIDWSNIIYWGSPTYFV